MHTLTCRGGVTYYIESLPPRGRAHGRDRRVTVVHPHRAPRSSPRPRPAPYRIRVQSLFEPTHGKTTKIALQATPELRSYRITSSRPLLFAGLQGGERPKVGLLRRRSRPQSCRCMTPGASEGTWLSRCPSRQPARRPLLSQETSLRAAPWSCRCGMPLGWLRPLVLIGHALRP